MASIGSTLKAGGDASIVAGRDVVIASRAEEDSYDYQRLRSSGTEQTIQQHASAVDIGGDLSIDARRDIAVIASSVSAVKHLSVTAGESLTLAAAANEHHDYAKEKKGKTKTTTQSDQVIQQSAELKAGGDLIAVAGTDLTLMASKISAGNEAYLHADNELSLLAAQDSNYSLYDMKKKGGWGSKKTRRDEVTDLKNVSSEIKTGGDLTLSSGGDQLYQAAKLNSGNDIEINSGGAVTFEAVKDLHQESHEKSNDNAFWISSKGKGNTDETVRQTQMIAEGNIAIKAVDGLKIDIRQVDQQTVSQSIDAMVKADPQLAWLKDAEKRGDVDWRQVREIHDSFKYSNSGLGPASQIIIAILMAAVIGPMAMGAMAGATGTAVAAGTMTASTAAGLSAAAGAVAAGAATNATVSAVNNRGNLGAVIKDVTSSDAVKGYVISGVTAGVTAGYFDDLTGTKTNTGTGKVNVPLNTWKGVGQFAANQTLQSGTSLALSKALGQGGNVSDALKSALFNILAAASFNAVGDYTQGVLADGSAPKIAIQAMVGGLLAEATGGDFKTGALAAGANEALVGHLNDLVKGDEALLTMSSQIVGVLAAAAQHDVDASKLEKGKWIAQNLTQYNFLNHQEVKNLIKEARECSATNTCDQVRNKFADLNDANDKRLREYCSADPSGCRAAYQGFVSDSNQTFELLSQARTSSDIPESLKAAMGAAQLFNTQAKMFLATESVAAGTVQVGVDVAEGLGFDVDPETAASVAKGVTGSAVIIIGGKGPKGAKVNEGSISHISGVNLSKSQSKMIADFEAAGYPTKPVVSPTSGNVVGTQYILPDGSRVRVMQADGRSPQRASFENANGGPVDPTTGKPPQPPQGLSKTERKQWIRERTHIEQVD